MKPRSLGVICYSAVITDADTVSSKIPTSRLLTKMNKHYPRRGSESLEGWICVLIFCQVHRPGSSALPSPRLLLVMQGLRGSVLVLFQKRKFARCLANKVSMSGTQIHLALAYTSVCFRWTSRWRYKPTLPSSARPALSNANKSCDFPFLAATLKGVKGNN